MPPIANSEPLRLDALGLGRGQHSGIYLIPVGPFKPIIKSEQKSPHDLLSKELSKQWVVQASQPSGCQLCPHQEAGLGGSSGVHGSSLSPQDTCGWWGA